MIALVLIALAVLAGLGILASLVCALVFAVKKRGRAVCISLGVAALCGAICITSAVMLAARGYRAASSWVAKSRAEVQKAEEKRAAHISRLKGYVAPGVVVPERYYTDFGFRDFWRFPMVWPYEMFMIDDLDSGNLAKYSTSSGKTSIEQSITHLCHDGQFLLARRDPAVWPEEDKSKPVEWLIFEFATGTLSRYTSESAMREEALRRGYVGEIKLLTIRKHLDAYFP